MIRNYFMILLVMFASLTSLASVNYHGRIINQSTSNPLVSTNVRFNIKIKAGASCVVYEENHDNINMSSSNGYFSLNIGDGSAVFGTFDNSMKIDGTTVNCQSSGSVSLTSVISKSIDVEVLEDNLGSYTTNISTITGLEIKDTPVAIAAKSLGGKSATDFIQVSGAVSQSAISDLITGTSTLYLQSADFGTTVAPYVSGKMDKSSNLSDVANIITARSNLGLGSIAVLNSITDSEITSLAYSKLTGAPTAFTPTSHTHIIGDITNLQTTLNSKVNNSQLSLNCTSAQTVSYNSVGDNYSCQSILIPSTQVSGLGSLATLNSVADANISNLSGSKLTGAVQIGTLAGTTCTSAGLTRYNSGVLEYCNGSTWSVVSSYSTGSVPIISNWTSYTPTFQSLGTVVNPVFRWRRVGSSVEIEGAWTNGTVTGGQATVSLPAGLVGTAPYYFVCGNYGGQGSTTSGNLVYHYLNNVLVFGMANWQVLASGTQLANGGITTLRASVPILGWTAFSNNVVAYTAPVKAKYRSGTAQSLTLGSETIVDFSSMENDSTGSLVTTGASWKFTAPTAGLYSVKTSVHPSAANTAFLVLFKNNVSYERIGQQPVATSSAVYGATEVQLNAGEYIDVRVVIGTTATTTLANTTLNWISIVRLSD